MSSSTTTALVEPPAMSNRRQPVRQARVNPLRNTTGARILGAGPLSAMSDQIRSDIPPGFFPGLTHFTDSITALPREMIRHYTMLKEVDAKTYHPEEALKVVVADILKTEPTPMPIRPHANVAQLASFPASEAQVPPDDSPQAQQYNLEQREQFLQLRILLNGMLPTLDEKTHVMSTATDALDKQLARLASSWPEIEKEISEETRWGSLNHWAYTSNAVPEKKASATGERPRRGEAAGVNGTGTLVSSTADTEPPSRVLDSRAIAAPARKHRINHNDSDFDEPKVARKATNVKGRKVEPTSAPTAAGLGIANGTIPNKRRKVEKVSSVVGSQPMDRSMSSVYSSNVRGPTSGSLLDAPPVDTSKKRGRAGNANANAQSRKRAGTANSTANSPSLASSPVVGTFSTTVRGGNSPALGAPMQRSTSTRARQNSTQTAASSNRPTSAVHKEANGNGVQHTFNENGHATKNTENSKSTKQEEVGNNDSNVRTSGRSADRSNLKREEPSSSRHRPPSISTATRNNGKASKTATPVSSSFPEPPRPRSGRNISATSMSIDAPIKRSHKKGGGIGAMAAAAAVAAAKVNVTDDDGTSVHGDDDEDLEGEPRYCYCNSVSYGEMVACDYADCKREWFHLDCAGLAKAPKNNEKWYCKDCAPKMR